MIQPRGYFLTHVLFLTAAFIAGTGQFASAATLCVNPGGTSGCSSTITAAVAAASAGDTIQVAPGTYAEDVIITKSLSLIGTSERRSDAVINAAGKANGIFINGTAGAPKSGVSNVVVSGFTVEDANFEGILIANASTVTIAGNVVAHNDMNLTSNGSCPGLPDFETNEAFDCGEGIHLSGVDHSLIADNTVEHNSGGILISDETGPTHDNLITGNHVTQNPYDCGITMPSHSPAPMTGAHLNFGVFHNTVSTNDSSYNGLAAPGAGAGIGLFAPGPGASVYGNVIIGNTLVGNGLPGVTMHNHAAAGVGGVPVQAPPVNFNDNLITENYIAGNLGDTDDAATPGTTGINVYSLAPMSGTMISKNVIANEAFDVVVKIPSAPSGSQPPINVHLNSFTPRAVGIDDLTSAAVDATENWWGCPGGPSAPRCATVIGAGVLFTPWLTEPSLEPLH